MSVSIPTQAIARLCNPFRSTPWQKRVTRAMVATCLGRNALCAHPVGGSPGVTADTHAGRIAYFVWHSWHDAIEIDVGVPRLLCHVRWMVQDGNHRLAAAIYRGDPAILADISGDTQYAAELFGIEERAI